jgi:hypothetical protein
MTVQKILKNWKVRRHACKKSFLEPEHKKQQMKFESKKYSYWRICWSDKSIFKIEYDDQTWWITHGSEEEYLNKNLKSLSQSEKTAIEVWRFFINTDLKIEITTCFI